jgi:hypothetical protein
MVPFVCPRISRQLKSWKVEPNLHNTLAPCVDITQKTQLVFPLQKGIFRLSEIFQKTELMESRT